MDNQISVDTSVAAPMMPSLLPSFSTLWSDSWSFVFQNIQRFFFVTLLTVAVYAPSMGVSWYFESLVDQNVRTAILIGLASISLVLSVLGYLIAMPFMIVNAMHGGAITWGELLKRVGILMVPMGIATLFFYAAILGAMIFLIIPGVILALYLMPVFFLVADGHPPRTAVRAAIQLTTGYWLAIAGRTLLLCLVTIVLFFVGLLLMGFLAVLTGILFSGTGTIGLIVLAILGIAAYSFLIAMMSGIAMRFSYSLYTELKLRQSVEPVSNWWAGKSLLVFTAIGCVLLALIALTSPIEQVREAREAIQLK